MQRNKRKEIEIYSRERDGRDSRISSGVEKCLRPVGLPLNLPLPILSLSLSLSLSLDRSIDGIAVDDGMRFSFFAALSFSASACGSAKLTNPTGEGKRERLLFGLCFV
jgi:hypothetical protein